LYKMSSDEEVSIVSTSNIDKDKKVVKNISGCPEGPVWNYFTKGKQVGKRKYEATCNFCELTWNHGEPSELENHLANHYQKADSIIICQFLTKILSNNSEQEKSKVEIRLLIEEYKIDEGGFKNYSKTRWTTTSDSVESVIHLEKVLKK
ncbi:14319_t:CDS:2, partial [Dentiscutata erythropus]